MKTLSFTVAALFVGFCIGVAAGAEYFKKKPVHVQIVHHYNEEANYYVQPDSMVRIPCGSSYIVVRNK